MSDSRVFAWMKRHVRALSAVLAFFSVWGLTRYGLRIREDRLGITNSVVSLLLIAAAFWLFYRAIPLLTRRLFAYSAVSGVLFSAMLVLGTELYYDDHVRLGEWKKWIGLLLAALLFAAITALLLDVLPRVQQWAQKGDWRRLGRDRLATSRCYFFVVWALLFVAYVPAWLASFPGIYAYDSVYQMKWMYSGTLNSHHPLLHSFYLYASLRLGEVLFHSLTAGMAFYSVTQMLMLSAAFAYVCRYLARRRVHPAIQAAVIAFFALWPINAMFSVSATKDVLFAALLLLCVVFTLDMVLDQEAFFASGWRIARYIAALFLMMNLRNNGFYMLIVLTPFLVILMRRYWKKIVPICLIPLLGYSLLTGPIYRAMGVEPGDKREALCTPIQMIARAANYNRDELTDEEYAKICELIPEQYLKNYCSATADSVKNHFDTAQFNTDKAGYIKVWLKVGLKCPGTYLDGLLATTYGFWYPDMAYPDPEAWHPYTEFKNTEQLEPDWVIIPTQSLCPRLFSFYQRIAYDTAHQRLPGVSMLFSPGFSFWTLLLSMLCMLYYKQRQLLLAPLLLFLLWGTLLLSPVVLLRYAYPIMISMPVVVALMTAQTWTVPQKKIT